MVTVAGTGPEMTPPPLRLSHRIRPTGEAIVEFGGELDIASAAAAVSYVREVIDGRHRPVTVDLTALAFCDAQGLAALVRMAKHAKRKGCPFRIASPSPALVRIMRITGLDRRFLTPQ
jgi:anti-anti-sigma factor